MKKLLLLSVILAGSILPAVAYPTITEWTDLECVYLDDRYSKCELRGGETGELKETTYWDRVLNIHTYTDPR